jgi:hypothetical protein
LSVNRRVKTENNSKQVREFKEKSMERPFFTVAVAMAIAFAGMTPHAAAAASDSISFNMVGAAGAGSCLSRNARGRATVSDLGFVQNMHVEVFGLPASTDFTLFVVNTPNAPFTPAWYQGDVTTSASGKGVVDGTGIFSHGNFLLNPGTSAVPVEVDHLGIWFADPADAVERM